MQTAHASIGRTNGADASRILTPRAWDTFRADVRDALRLASHAVMFAGEWSGTTRDEVGISEESAHFQTVAESIDAAFLRDALGIIAHRYGQRHIALTLGASELVDAT